MCVHMEVFMCVHTEVYGGGVHVCPYRGVWRRCSCASILRCMEEVFMCVHTEVYGGGVHVCPYRGVWRRCSCTESDQETDITYRLYSVLIYISKQYGGRPSSLLESLSELFCRKMEWTATSIDGERQNRMFFRILGRYGRSWYCTIYACSNPLSTSLTIHNST